MKSAKRRLGIKPALLRHGRFARAEPAYVLGKMADPSHAPFCLRKILLFANCCVQNPCSCPAA